MTRSDLIHSMCKAADGRQGLMGLTNVYCSAAQKAHQAGDIKAREQHFDALIMILDYVAQTRDIDFAVEWIEPQIYNRVVKLTEDEDQVHAKMQRIIPIINELGEWVKNQLPPIGGLHSTQEMVY